MPKSSPSDDDSNKNAPYRSSRRSVRRDRELRVGRRRQITVRSELREEPDVRKIARAIIGMAMLEAEREAQAKAEQESREAPDA